MLAGLKNIPSWLQSDVALIYVRGYHKQFLAFDVMPITLTFT